MLHRTPGPSRPARLAPFVGAALIAAGLAAPAAAAEPSESTVGSPIVIRIGYEGGFVMPGTDITRFPIVAVTADGTVYALGAQIEIWPSPLLPPVFVSHITPDQVAALLAQAAEAGLTPEAPVAYPAIDVADAPDLVFEIAGPGGTHTTAFGAWGLDQPSLGDAEIAARSAAQGFLDAVIAASLADPAPAPFVPAAVAIVSMPYYSDPDPEMPQEPVTWPIGVSLATGGSPLFADSPDGRCIVIEGEDAVAAWPLFEAANVLTPFTSEAGDRQLQVRPLIPGEPSPCP